MKPGPPTKESHELRLSWKSSAGTLVKSSTIAKKKHCLSRSMWGIPCESFLFRRYLWYICCNTSVSPTRNNSKIFHVMKFVDLFSSAQDASFICCHQHILDMMIHVNIVVCSVPRTAHDVEALTTAWRILILRQEETDYAYVSQLRVYVLNHQLHRA